MPAIQMQLSRVNVSSPLPITNPNVPLGIPITQIHNVKTPSLTTTDSSLPSSSLGANAKDAMTSDTNAILAKLGVTSTATQSHVTANENTATSVTQNERVNIDPGFAVDEHFLLDTKHIIRNKREAAATSNAVVDEPKSLDCFNLRIEQIPERPSYRRIRAKNNCDEHISLAYQLTDDSAKTMMGIPADRAVVESFDATINKKTLTLTKGVNTTIYHPASTEGDNISLWVEAPQQAHEPTKPLRAGIHKVRLYVDNRLDKPVEGTIERCNNQDDCEGMIFKVKSGGKKKPFDISLFDDHKELKVKYTTTGGLKFSHNDETITDKITFAENQHLSLAIGEKHFFDLSGDGVATMLHTFLPINYIDRLNIAPPELEDGSVFPSVTTKDVEFRIRNKWTMYGADVAFNFMKLGKHFHLGPVRLFPNELHEGHFVLPKGSESGEFHARYEGWETSDQKMWTAIDINREMQKADSDYASGKAGAKDKDRMCGFVVDTTSYISSFDNLSCYKFNFNGKNDTIKDQSSIVKEGVFVPDLDPLEMAFGRTIRI